MIITLVGVPIIGKKGFFLQDGGMRDTKYKKGSGIEADYGTCGESWGDFWEEEEEEEGGGGGGWELDNTVSEGFSAIVDLDHAKCVRVSLNLKMNENKNSR